MENMGSTPCGTWCFFVQFRDFSDETIAVRCKVRRFSHLAILVVLGISMCFFFGNIYDFFQAFQLGVASHDSNIYTKHRFIPT